MSKQDSDLTSQQAHYDQIEQRQKQHILYTWTPQKQAQSVPIVSSSGSRFYDAQGQAWFDFESQVFNCNLGHQHPKVIKAIQDQAQKLACAHPAAVFEAKARLGELLNQVTPSSIDHFFLCLSGSEAIENAYKVARMVTKRSKVIARRRSYHGASMGALSLTGDARRLPLEPGLWGGLRAEDPYCYRCPFGLKPESCGVKCATHLEYLIQMEGPDQIAAIFLEGLTGSNGGFIPPADYWPTVRKICDRYGILLVADEVFSGFGRTGKWFAVDHWDVQPDLITMAKGITSGYVPMGALGISSKLAKHFEDETLWCGLTSYGNPIACATAVATIETYIEEGIIENAATQGHWLTAELSTLPSRYQWAGNGRCLGLFGTIEFADHLPAPFYVHLKNELKKRRIHALIKAQNLFITPPLCITRTELEEGMHLVYEAVHASIEALN